MGVALGFDSSHFFLIFWVQKGKGVKNEKRKLEFEILETPCIFLSYHNGFASPPMPPNTCKNRLQFGDFTPRWSQFKTQGFVKKPTSTLLERGQSLRIWMRSLICAWHLEQQEESSICMGSLIFPLIWRPHSWIILSTFVSTF